MSNQNIDLNDDPEYQVPLNMDQSRQSQQPRHEAKSKKGPKFSEQAKELVSLILDGYSSRLLILIVVLTALFAQNAIGLFFASSISISLVLESNNRWKYTWLSILLSSIIVFVFQILVLIIAPNSREFADITVWLGTGFDFAGSWALFLVVIVLIGLSLGVRKIKNAPSPLMSDEEYAQVKEKYAPLFKKEDSHAQPKTEAFKKLEAEFKYVRLRFYYKQVDNTIKFVYHYCGYELSLFSLLLLAFMQLSFVSIAYIIIVYLFSFKNSVFQVKSVSQQTSLSRLKKVWRLIYILLTADLIRQYLFMIWFPLSWNIPKFFQSWTFGCNQEAASVYAKEYPWSKNNDYEKCVASWRNWLSIGDFTSSGIFMSFICVYLMVNYDSYFRSLNDFDPTEHKSGDSQDFTRKSKKSMTDHYKFFIYGYFWIIPTILLILVGLSDSITAQTDVLSSLYFLSGLIFLCNYKYLLSKKNKVWNYVEFFNFCVLLATIIYQIPFFPCPLAIEGRYYFLANECVELQEEFNNENQNTLNSLNSSNFLYTIIDIIGLNKISRASFSSHGDNILMILLFLLGSLLRKVWQHGYIKVYLDPYFSKKELENFSRAAKCIRSVHMSRISSYKGAILLRDMAIWNEIKVQKRLKEWETLFGIQLESDDEDESDDFKALLHSQDKEAGGISPDSKSIKQAEALELVEYVLDKYPESRIIGFKNLIKIAVNAKYDKESVEKKVIHQIIEQKKEFYKNLAAIPEINLPEYKAEDIPADQKKVEVSFAIDDGDSDEEGKPKEEKKDDEEEEKGDHKDLSEIRKESQEASKVQEISKEASIIKRLLVLLIRKSTFIQDKDKVTTEDNYMTLILHSLFAHIDKICFLFFLLNFLYNPSLISIVYPLTALIYANIEYPFPTTRYWKIMIWYTTIVMIAKFLYQLPFFCGNPAFQIKNIFNTSTTCSTEYYEPWTLPSRIDYLIGIHKFSGAASYPVNEGTLRGIIFDVLVLAIMLVQRSMLDSEGIWNYVRIHKNAEYVPQLANPPNKERYIHLETQPNEGEESQDEEEKRNDSELGNALNNSNDNQEENEEGGNHINIDREEDGEASRNEPKPDYSTHDIATPAKFYRNLYAYNIEKTDDAQIRKPGRDFHGISMTFGLVTLIFFILFYKAMQGSGGSITDIINQSQFSGSLVIIMIVTIAVILLERILYVNRDNLFKGQLQQANESGTESERSDEDRPKKKIKSDRFFKTKLIMHFSLVLVVNGFFFYLILNSLMQEEVNNFGTVAFAYLLCSYYLLFSALQIKFGYPYEVKTSLFTSPDAITGATFKAYRAIPFVYEIAAILDWTVTRTSLDLFEWMKLEDAANYLYTVKIEMVKRSKMTKGVPRPKKEKLTFGCSFVCFLVFIVIAPILLFSSFNPSKALNNVTSGNLNLQFQAASPTTTYIFEIYNNHNIELDSVDGARMKELEQTSGKLKQEGKDQQQLQKLSVIPYSETQWLISEPGLNNLEELLQSSSVTIYVTMTWEFKREQASKNPVSKGMNTVILSEDQRDDLLKMLDGEQKFSLILQNLMPKFINLNSLGQTTLFGTENMLTQQKQFMTDAELKYIVDKKSGNYWTLTRMGGDPNQKKEDQTFFAEGDTMTVCLVNEYALGSIFSSLGSLGFIGIYVTVVLAVGRIVRELFDKVSQRVIYEEMPNPDDLREICNAIYIARMEGNYKKEYRLYNTLIRLYRSPEMLLKLTGLTIPKKSINE